MWALRSRGRHDGGIYLTDREIVSLHHKHFCVRSDVTAAIGFRHIWRRSFGLSDLIQGSCRAPEGPLPLLDVLLLPKPVLSADMDQRDAEQFTQKM
jgi:hypothetical protein